MLCVNVEDGLTMLKARCLQKFTFKVVTVSKALQHDAQVSFSGKSRHGWKTEWC
jgi:hypothetical protein